MLPGSDYGIINQNLVFNSSSTNRSCVTVEIFEDTITENNEVFTISLSTTDSRVSIPDSEASVTITDNDGNQKNRWCCSRPAYHKN